MRTQPGATQGLPGHSPKSTIGVSAALERPGQPVRETKVTIKIPRPLYRKIEQVVDGSGFNSPTDFIVYVLRDLMGEAESRAQTEMGASELEELKRKLKKLGYL